MIAGSRGRWIAAGAVAAAVTVAVVVDRFDAGAGAGSDPGPGPGPGAGSRDHPLQPPAVQQPSDAGAGPTGREGSSRSVPSGTTAVDEPADLARRTVAAWQIEDPAARTDALSPLVTPEWLALSTTIDPARVPTAPVTTAAVRVDADGEALVDVQLADGTDLAVMLGLVDGRWLVEEILPTGDRAD